MVSKAGVALVDDGLAQTLLKTLIEQAEKTSREAFTEPNP